MKLKFNNFCFYYETKNDLIIYQKILLTVKKILFDLKKLFFIIIRFKDHILKFLNYNSNISDKKETDLIKKQYHYLGIDL